MAQVQKYQVRIWGGPDGFSPEGRARIQLSADNWALGWIYFHDDATSIPNDSQTINPQYQKEQIHMHLPSMMLESVIDLLRNESPVFFTYAWNHGVLTTGSEEIGEGE